VKIREIKGNNDNTLGDLVDEISTLSDVFLKTFKNLKKL